jgi:hypothetical protein
MFCAVEKSIPPRIIKGFLDVVEYLEHGFHETRCGFVAWEEYGAN